LPAPALALKALPNLLIFRLIGLKTDIAGRLDADRSMPAAYALRLNAAK
jgi:hypothetical protein